MQKILADDTFCVYIATAVDFSIQVQMNQWKIVWLLVWIKCDILSGVVEYSSFGSQTNRVELGLVDPVSG